MHAEKLPPPQLSPEEQLLLAAEQQLLNDGRLWLRRAADLYTRTSKIKIWVPVLGSMLMTGYYLYTMHARAAAPLDQMPHGANSVAVVVKDVPAAAEPVRFTPPGHASVVSNEPAEDDSPSMLKERAEKAHADQQFSEEAKLWQQFADQTGAPRLVCPAIGKAYERAGQIDESVQAFEQCVSAEPGNVDTLLAFAHVLQTKQDFKRANALYRQCLLKDPASMDARTGLALVELNQNHLDEANTAAQGILRKSPDNTDALLIAGVVAWRQTRLNDAEKVFQKGVGVDDRRADFHAFLGRIAEAQRRPQDALRQYERALELDPHDTEIADRRDRLKDAR